MDSLAMITLTIPIFFPVITSLGFDPIWFGVIIVVVTEMGVITPPVGINVYVVAGVARDVPLHVIFNGALHMLLAAARHGDPAHPLPADRPVAAGDDAVGPDDQNLQFRGDRLK